MNAKKQQELDENLQFLRGQFQELNREIKLPHSLEADMLRYRLENMDLSDDKARQKRRWLKPVMGMAACFVVVIGSVLMLNPGKDNGLMSSPAPANEEMAADMQRGAPMPQAAAFSADAPEMAAYSGGELVSYALDYTQLRDQVYQMNGGMEKYSDQEQVIDRATVQAAPPELSGDDLVKLQGEYLYTLVPNPEDGAAPAIEIRSVASSSSIPAASITLEPERTVYDFYVMDKRLITVSGGVSPSQSGEAMPMLTEVTDDTLVSEIGAVENATAPTESLSAEVVTWATVYDITDPENPKELSAYAQDGAYLVSNVADGQLYLLSMRTATPDLSDPNATAAQLIPCVYPQGKAQLLPADQILLVPDAAEPTYGVLSALDSVTDQVQTQAVLGAGLVTSMGPDGCQFSYDKIGGGSGDLLLSVSGGRLGLVAGDAGIAGE